MVNLHGHGWVWLDKGIEPLLRNSLTNQKGLGANGNRDNVGLSQEKEKTE